jgi:PEP-CTERM motif
MRHVTRRIGLAVAVLGLVIGAAPARAGFVFTDRAAFLADVQPGYYLEDFNGLPGNTDLGPSVSFSGGGFSYDATNPNDLFTTPSIAGDVALSTFDSGQSITITFTGAPVTAVGGNIFGSDISGIYTPGAITMQLDDGESITLPNPDPTSFAGFITSSPIVSVSIFPEGFNSAYWATLDNLIVGQAAVTAVPEPSSLISAGIAGVLGLGYGWRRRRARVAG